ncbi:hypothetical protein [Gemmata massiliana]|nr:hypothetical protein [Gemmata massiliana]
MSVKNGKKLPKKKPNMRERSKARQVMEKVAKKTGEMSAAERRARLAYLNKELNKLSPGLDVAESDVFKALLALGAEFIARYFPDASSASFHVTKYAPGKGGPVYSVVLPMAVPSPVGAYEHLRKDRPSAADTESGAVPTKPQENASPTPQPAKPSSETFEQSMSKCDMLAMAWVNAIRSRVRDLVDDVDPVINVGADSRWKGAEAALETVIDRSALGNLFRCLEEVERIVEELLPDDGIVRPVPALARMCREVAQQLGFVQPEANS